MSCADADARVPPLAVLRTARGGGRAPRYPPCTRASAARGLLIRKPDARVHGKEDADAQAPALARGDGFRGFTFDASEASKSPLHTLEREPRERCAL